MIVAMKKITEKTAPQPSRMVMLISRNKTLKGKEDAAAKENGEIDADKEERKFIEVMSPQNEKTLIPKRKTGL